MTGIVPRIGTALLAAVLGCAIAVAQGWQHLGKLQRVEKLKDGVELTAGAARVRVTVFRDGVFRVRLAPNGVRRQFALSDWPILGDASPFLPMRIGADGSLYQLETSVTTGARIARYSLGASTSTQFECGG